MASIQLEFDGLARLLKDDTVNAKTTRTMAFVLKAAQRRFVDGPLSNRFRHFLVLSDEEAEAWKTSVEKQDVRTKDASDGGSGSGAQGAVSERAQYSRQAAADKTNGGASGKIVVPPSAPRRNFFGSFFGRISAQTPGDDSPDFRHKPMERLGPLLPNTLSVSNAGLALGGGTTLCVSARADSYYEYLLKLAVLRPHSKDAPRLKKIFADSIKRISDHLVKWSPDGRSAFLGSVDMGKMEGNAKTADGNTHVYWHYLNRMDHLTCFLPGVLTIAYFRWRGISNGGPGSSNDDGTGTSATHPTEGSGYYQATTLAAEDTDTAPTGTTDHDDENYYQTQPLPAEYHDPDPLWLKLAEGLLNSCVRMYDPNLTKLGLAPEYVNFNALTDEVSLPSGADAPAFFNKLRPETLESLYVMHFFLGGRECSASADLGGGGAAAEHAGHDHGAEHADGEAGDEGIRERSGKELEKVLKDVGWRGEPLGLSETGAGGIRAGAGEGRVVIIVVKVKGLRLPVWRGYAIAMLKGSGRWLWGSWSVFQCAVVMLECWMLLRKIFGSM